MANLQLARVALQNTDNSDQEILIDLILDGDAIRPSAEYFGVWQDRGERSRCPFVMSQQGQIDFGTGFDGQDRYYDFGILKNPVAIGGEATYGFGGNETTFNIMSITRLL